MYQSDCSSAQVCRMQPLASQHWLAAKQSSCQRRDKPASDCCHPASCSRLCAGRAVYLLLQACRLSCCQQLLLLCLARPAGSLLQLPLYGCQRLAATHNASCDTCGAASDVSVFASATVASPTVGETGDWPTRTCTPSSSHSQRGRDATPTSTAHLDVQ